MHISDTQETNKKISTKCTKMTTDDVKRNGMNGISDKSHAKEESKSFYGQGGRLKFFKDGKFILEIERACNGEKMSWVSVPRKTFWPPQGTAISTTPTYRQENSVSDDNSSVQSSPWQRDHSWKQTTPKRNISKEMCFYFERNKTGKLFRCKNKRRLKLLLSLKEDDNNKEQDDEIKCNINKENGVTMNNNNNNNNINNKRKVSLMCVVQMLNDKLSLSSSQLQQHQQQSCRMENVVSPRKRFLREMENCKLQTDDVYQKRIKSKQGGNVDTTTNNNANNCNGNLTTKETKTTSKCNYSITSLLSDDNSVKRRSPLDDGSSPSHFVQVQRRGRGEDLWYAENIYKCDTIDLTQPNKAILASLNAYPCIPPFPHPYSMPSVYPYGRATYGMIPSMYSTTALPIPRPDVPSCSWTTAAGDIHLRNEKNDDNISDLPLNLSKHAG